jgi:hypothetical protein
MEKQQLWWCGRVLGEQVHDEDMQELAYRRMWVEGLAQVGTGQFWDTDVKDGRGANKLMNDRVYMNVNGWPWEGNTLNSILIAKDALYLGALGLQKQKYIHVGPTPKCLSTLKDRTPFHKLFWFLVSENY